MAQLPPKVPNETPIWPEFSKLPHPYMAVAAATGGGGNYNGNANPEFSKLPHPYMAVAAATGGGGNYNGNVNPSWVDEFLDFSSARRGVHRRSASDSIAFLEMPLLEHCRGVTAAVPCARGNATGEEFDRLDDDQFMMMFTDEISPSVVVPTVSSSNPSSLSDHDSINEDKQGTPPPLQQQLHPKNEPEEVQCPCRVDATVAALDAWGTNDGALNVSTERIFDPKRVKRILANRQSAQRSRVRKLQYISELERSVNTLQAEVSVLSPRVAFLDHQRLLLNVDNSALKQRIAALAQDNIFKDAHHEALKREIERLRQVYHQRKMQKVEEEDKDNGNVTCSSSDPDPPRLENGQILGA